ncbi:MAG TPA: primosomal protein N' [Methylocella sp.]|nr:primosomal protein N' [Methylocella sp.]
MMEKAEAGSAVQDRAVADVLLPLAVPQAYSYLAPKSLLVSAGDFVEVPLGSRKAIGIVWDTRAAGAPASNLKAIAARLDLPPLPANTRAFVDWIARWTLAPPGMVLRMAIRPAFLREPEPLSGVRLTGSAPGGRMTEARARILRVLEGSAIVQRAALAKAAGCSLGVIDALVTKGVLGLALLPPEPLAEACSPTFTKPALTADQQTAATCLYNRVLERAFSVTLLEGVTGSGKTEVYFEAIAAALAAGRQSLVLMPEIALTAQFLDRFASRFGARPAVWHSEIPARKKSRLWRAIATGEVLAVAGARSALFLPFKDLAMIVVDEEHDAAYKQEDGVSYHARDMAVVRGQIEKSTVVLSTATPSLESRANAEQGRYRHIELSERFNARPLPAIEAIDLRTALPARGKWIAPRLAAAIAQVLQRNEQALLFLNRRGYAPLTLCRACGHRFQCPNCTAWLVEHRFRRTLMCHHCGHTEQRPALCPACEAADSLTACGPGIERLAEESAALFPHARILTLSSDFAGGVERLRAEIEAISRGGCDIVIGTQLVAKGHNFPKLSLVGVIDADVGLTSGDPRAAERTFQLLQQVTGRAGRFETNGQAFVQTWQPEHPVMRALLSGQSERFYQEESRQRRMAGLPPFGRLAAVIVSGTDAAKTEAHARALARAAHALPPSKGWKLAKAHGISVEGELALLGPAEAPIAVIRGRHRFRLLVRAPRSADLQGFLRTWLAAGPPEKNGIRAVVDIDPQSFL